MTGMSNVGICYRCRCEIWIPRELDQAARKSSKIEFFCAYGHGQVFAEGETEEEKLRRERNQLIQQLAYKDDQIKTQRELREAIERQLSASRGQITKIKKRVGHGICPCCNRMFENLQRHMTSKHPTYASEAAE